MRRLLYWLGAATLAIIVMAGTGLGVFVYRGITLDASSRAYVDSAVPAIAADWDRQQLLERITPELRAEITPATLRVVFDMGSRLGPMVAYQGARGAANMSYVTGSGGSVSAAYVAKVKCRDGNATIRIALLERDGRWMISGFYVDSTPFNAAGPRI